MPIPGEEEEVSQPRPKRKRQRKKRKRQRMKVTPYKTGDEINLRELLCYKKRDYLINNKGDKIKVSDLEDKVVALYLYEEGFTTDLTAILKGAYENLQSAGNKFEIVLVYMFSSWNTHGRTDSKTFKNTFKTMPWLALPFKDIKSVQLPRIFRYPFELDEWHPDPSLVIIGPHGQFVVPFGAATVLKNFGVEAYPFTHDRAYELHAQRIKNMKLEMLWRPSSVFVRDPMSKSTSQEVVVPFGDILGKRLVVFSECQPDKDHLEFRRKLLERYEETKGGNDEFEVIHFKGENEAESVPWLIPRPCRGHAVDALARILYYSYGILVLMLMEEL